MKKTTKNAVVEQLKEERGTVPNAYAMALIGLEMVKQLRGIARTTANAKGVTPANVETERTDLMATIALFADNLGRIEDIVNEVIIILEEIEPTLTAVNE